MRQITVELEDGQMASLEAEARIKSLEPSILLALKMKAVLNAQLCGLDDSEQIPVDDIGSGNGNGKDDAAARRAARLAILERSCGIWQGEPGKPKDGVYYQEEMRSEWQ
jgi:hypothetical protein